MGATGGIGLGGVSMKHLITFVFPQWNWESGDVVHLNVKWTSDSRPSWIAVQVEKACGCGGVNRTEFFGAEAQALWRRLLEEWSL